jgi:hypothetical protein
MGIAAAPATSGENAPPYPLTRPDNLVAQVPVCGPAGELRAIPVGRPAGDSARRAARASRPLRDAARVRAERVPQRPARICLSCCPATGINGVRAVTSSPSTEYVADLGASGQTAEQASPILFSGAPATCEAPLAFFSPTAYRAAWRCPVEAATRRRVTRRAGDPSHSRALTRKSNNSP